MIHQMHHTLINAKQGNEAVNSLVVIIKPAKQLVLADLYFRAAKLQRGG